MNPRRRARAAGPVVFVWTDVDERRGVAVIRGFQHDHIALPGVRAGQAQAPARSPRWPS